MKAKTMLQGTVPMTIVRNQLIALVNEGLGRDVSFIADYITFQQLPGEPNWEAALRIQSLDILKVFTEAVSLTQLRFNIAW
jgi:hypothetical protein